MGVKIQDIPRIGELEARRSQIMQALGELPKEKDRWRIAAVEVRDQDSSGRRGSTLASVTDIPAPEMRIFLEARLAKIEDELIKMGVDVS